MGKMVKRLIIIVASLVLLSCICFLGIGTQGTYCSPLIESGIKSDQFNSDKKLFVEHEEVVTPIPTATPSPTNTTSPTLYDNSNDNSIEIDNQTTESNNSKEEERNPLPIYEETSVKMWVKDTLNIRSEASIYSQKLGTFHQGDEVTVVGIGNNGWDKIAYNNTTAYVVASYLSPTKIDKPHVETVSEEMARRGNMGRLVISDVGVNVALFYCTTENSSYAQQLVDAVDSAMYLDWWPEVGISMIGDHQDQGFYRIKNLWVGAECYIDRGTYKEKYIVSRIMQGENRLDGLYVNGENIGKSMFSLGESIVMYTCNGADWRSITCVTLSAA